MPDIDICPECRVPKHITSEHVWLGCGVIRSKRDERQRLIFFESGILDPVFKGIERLTDLPVEAHIIDAARKSSRAYIDRMIPGDVKSLIREGEMDLKLIVNAMILTSRLLGYGKVTCMELRFENDKDDFITVRFEKPYSLPLAFGSFAGSVQAFVGDRPDIKYEKVSPGVFDVTVFRPKNPLEPEKKLRWKGYGREYKPGDIELERCAECGGPKELFEFQWDLDSGVIRSTSTGRRMVMTGPSMIEPILDELEEAIGETISHLVIDAEMRFAKTGFVAIEELVDEDYIRRQLALRGMGNLSQLKIGEKSVRLRLENAALHLMGVGIAQGIFELAFNVQSEVDWELSEDGVLEIEVRPMIIRKAVGG